MNPISFTNFFTNRITKNSATTKQNRLEMITLEERFLQTINNPQQRFKTIHIAGTSGKGSVASLISKGLVDNNISSGLIVSPHVYDIRERFQYNNNFVDYTILHTLLSDFEERITVFEENNGMVFPYLQTLFLFGLYVLAYQKVQVTVIETGCGGLYDHTNITYREDSVAIITKLGLDHTELLGKTMEEITIQKAGIIKPNKPLYLLSTNPYTDSLLQIISQHRGSMAHIYKPKNIKNIDWREENKNFAGFVLRKEFNSDFNTSEEIYLPGRFETLTLRGETIILDGSHNEQKYTALVDLLHKHFPNKKISLLLASKKNHNPENLLNMLQPRLHTLYTIELSEIPEVCFDSFDYSSLRYNIIKGRNNKETIKLWMEEKDTLKLATGSFYHLSLVKNCIYQQSGICS